MSSLNTANNQGVILGLQTIDNEAPRLRYDIDVLLLKDPDTFNLLLIALMELKGQNVEWEIDDDYIVTKDNKMSYYKLAGI